MKKIITIILCVLLAIGAVGGSFALAKHLKDDSSVEQPNDSSTDSSQETPDENNSSGGGNGNFDGLEGIIAIVFYGKSSSCQTQDHNQGQSQSCDSLKLFHIETPFVLFSTILGQACVCFGENQNSSLLRGCLLYIR